MYIPRIAETMLVESLKSNKIVLILGSRQVGKTTLVKEVMKNRKTVFLNLDIEMDKARLLAASRLSPSEALRYLDSPDFLIIDEAQRLSDSTRIVKGWHDSDVSARFILLGSSSLDLLNQSAESLAGRDEKLFLPPLLFKETLCKEKWFPVRLDSVQSFEMFGEQIKETCFLSMIYGQYPEAVTTEDKEKFLLNLVSDYLFKDIFQLELIKTPEVIRRMLTLLAYQAGSEVSVNEISKSLSIARATVERYLELLEAAFVIFRLPSFGTNPRKEISKTHKVFFWDTGVRNALLKEFSTNKTRADIGALFENWVVAEAAKKNMLNGNRKNLYFWRSKGGSEVDLVIKENETISAYEIKWQKEKSIKTAFADNYGVPVKIVNINNFYPLIDLM